MSRIPDHSGICHVVQGASRQRVAVEVSLALELTAISDRSVVELKLGRLFKPREMRLCRGVWGCGD